MVCLAWNYQRMMFFCCVIAVYTSYWLTEVHSTYIDKGRSAEPLFIDPSSSGSNGYTHPHKPHSDKKKTTKPAKWFDRTNTFWHVVQSICIGRSNHYWRISWAFIRIGLDGFCVTIAMGIIGILFRRLFDITAARANKNRSLVVVVKDHTYREQITDWKKNKEKKNFISILHPKKKVITELLFYPYYEWGWLLERLVKYQHSIPQNSAHIRSQVKYISSFFSFIKE